VKLCQALGLEELAHDPRFASWMLRLDTARSCCRSSRRASAPGPRDEWLDTLRTHDIPAGRCTRSTSSGAIPSRATTRWRSSTSIPTSAPDAARLAPALLGTPTRDVGPPPTLASIPTRCCVPPATRTRRSPTCARARLCADIRDREEPPRDHHHIRSDSIRRRRRCRRHHAQPSRRAQRDERHHAPRADPLLRRARDRRRRQGVVVTGPATARSPPAPTSRVRGAARAVQFREARRRVDFRQAMDRCAQPILAAINGFALGAASSWRWRATSASPPPARRWVSRDQPRHHPGGGGTQRLPRLVGRGKALEMILTGARLRPMRRLRIASSSAVVPTGEALKAATELAHAIAAKAPVRCAMRRRPW